ncbi:MAG: hypothetical protein NC194_06630 [Prevotella sp.]|nr:hypothetical protein [Prevotella sp.]
MFVFDFLFGHHNKESFGVHRQREDHRFTDNYCHDDDYNSSYSGYSNNDYDQQDFDDELDSDMFDDDF